MVSDIEKWIFERLSVNLPEFNNLSACPFAKEAWTKNKVSVKQLKSKDDFIVELKHFSFNWPRNKEVIILGCMPDIVTSKELSNIVDVTSVLLNNNGLIALEDHPDEIEQVGNYHLNQGTYALILLQEIDRLNKARQILEKKNYYKNWSKEYYADVVKCTDIKT